MAWVSFNLSPVAPDWDNLSEPAKSIRFKVPSHVSSVIEFTPDNLNIKTLFFLKKKKIKKLQIKIWNYEINNN